MRKFKRRPKGTGSVTYLGEGRRKPYLAIIKKVCLGTYATEQAAEKALSKYLIERDGLFPSYIDNNDLLKDKFIDFVYDMQAKGIIDQSLSEADKEFMNTLYDLFKTQLLSNGNLIENANTSEIVISDSVPTFKEIWNIEYDRLEVGKSDSWRSSFNAAFNTLKYLHNLKINQIKTNELQNAFNKIISTSSCGKSKLNNMKIVCSRVFEYALKMDYILKDYSQYIISNPNSNGRNRRKPFTLDEIKILLKDKTDPSMKVLIYIFTGARPIELINMKRSNIHLEENYMIGGVKTKAGKERIIPIHPTIKPFVEYFLENYDYENLFVDNIQSKKAYTSYVDDYVKLMKKLNLYGTHKESYDTRYTFSTLAKTCHVETSAHKKIMGHSCKDLTDDVYTHEPIGYLLEEIKKIKI